MLGDSASRRHMRAILVLALAAGCGGQGESNSRERIERGFEAASELASTPIESFRSRPRAGGVPVLYLDAEGQITRENGWVMEANEDGVILRASRSGSDVEWRAFAAGPRREFILNGRRIATPWLVGSALVDAEGRAWVSYLATSASEDEPASGHGVGIYRSDGTLVTTIETSRFTVMDAIGDRVLISLGGTEFGSAEVRRLADL